MMSINSADLLNNLDYDYIIRQSPVCARASGLVGHKSKRLLDPALIIELEFPSQNVAV